MTSPPTLPSSGCPAYLVSAGLGSKVSTWLTPPLMNNEITAVARGLKCGAFGAYGLNPTGAGVAGAGLDDLPRQQLVLVQQIRQRQPAHAAARAEEKIASRPARLACVMRHLSTLPYCRLSRLPALHRLQLSPVVDELVHVQQHVGEIDERSASRGLERDRQLRLARRPRQRDPIREIDLLRRIARPLPSSRGPRTAAPAPARTRR